MKITSFNPQIISKDAESVVRLLEEMGFDRRHTKEDIGELNVTGISMKNADGFYVDVSETDAAKDKDIVAIRMNVDDFDSAYRLLKSRGYFNIYGAHTADTPSSKSAVLISPNGLAINLIQHIK